MNCVWFWFRSTKTLSKYVSIYGFFNCFELLSSFFYCNNSYTILYSVPSNSIAEQYDGKSTHRMECNDNKEDYIVFLFDMLYLNYVSWYCMNSKRFFFGIRKMWRICMKRKSTSRVKYSISIYIGRNDLTIKRTIHECIAMKWYTRRRHTYCNIFACEVVFVYFSLQFFFYFTTAI